VSLLPTVGEISYNGYEFGPNTETLSVNVKPAYDRAGRTVVHSVFSLTVRTILAGTAIDSAVRTIVRLLTKPACPLVFTGRGLPLAINVAGVRDVLWGPKPQVVSVRPLGGGNAVELTWTVEVAIPDCRDAVYQNELAELNFTMSFDIDQAGYTRRSYDGFVRIPMTRIAPKNRQLPDSVDLYRNDINPPLLPGFRRTDRSFTISEDKCTLTFSVRDEQMPPNVPPEGIVVAQASHSLASTPGKLVEWTGTLSASYEIARNGRAKVSDARDAFFALLKDRVGYTLATVPKASRERELRGGSGGSASSSDKGGTKQATVVPVSFTMSEPNIYGPTVCQFSCVYRVIGATLRAMLQASGLWRPADRDWAAWSESLGSLVLGPRGHADLVFSPNDDTIVDLCGPPGYADLTTGAGRRGQQFLDIPEDTFPEPEPESSWLGYENALFFRINNNLVPITPLPEKKRDAQNDIGGKLPNVPPPPGLFDAEDATKPPVGTQGYNPGDAGKNAGDPFFDPDGYNAKRGGKNVQRKAQSANLVMIGRAVRVRYAIPMPTLDKWGDAKLTPANDGRRGDGFVSGVVGNVGWPVVGARWQLNFFCEKIPDAPLPILPGPFDGRPK
jgi:hypothetical protein